MPDEPTESHSADRIGPYRLIEELGRGGQGAVYLAEDTRLGRKVALKIVDAVGPVPENRLARFRREATAASKLDHPNICTLLEAGELEGIPYLAMRYVEGETLTQMIGRRELYGDSLIDPTTRDGVFAIVSLIEKVARALHHAHERGLIHRDIKPGNVMLTGAGEPVVLDFGLARDELADSHDLTVTGDLLGTPRYMSPEQLVAQRIPLDRRTDVYSLGAVLYECLTGKPPFQAATRAELYQTILRGEPASATSENRQIPRDLQVVVETALDRDRDRRYQTALDLAEDLRHVREFEPIRARPIPWLLRGRRWFQRHPARGVAVCGLLLALFATTAFLADRNRRLLERTGNALSFAASEVVDDSPMTALYLALRGYDLAPSARALSQIQLALRSLHERASFWLDSRLLCMSLQPDRRIVAVGTESGRLWMFDYAGVRISDWTLDGAVLDCRFSTEGDELLAVSEAGSLVEVGVDAVSPTYLVRGERSGPRLLTATVSPDGAWFARSDRQATRLIARDGSDIPCGLVLRPLRSGRYMGRSAVFSPTGEFAVLTGVSDSVRIGHDRVPVSLGYGGLTAAAFSPRGELVTGDVRGVLRVHPGGSKNITTAQAHSGAIAAIGLSPSGNYILTMSTADMHLRMWERSGRPLGTVAHHSGNIVGAAFLSAEEYVATWSADATVGIWRSDGREMFRLAGHQANITAGILDSVANSLATASYSDGNIRVWDLTGREESLLFGHTERVENVAFLSNEELVTVGRDGLLRRWRNREPTPALIDDGVPLFAVAGSATVVVAGGKGRVYVEELGPGPPESWSIPIGGSTVGVESSSTVWRLAVHPNGSEAIIPTATIELLDLVERRFVTPPGLAPLREEIGALGARCASYSRDGRLIAVGTNDGRLFVVDRSDWSYRELAQAGAGVRTVAFNADVDRVVWASDDRPMVVVTDLDTGKQRTLEGIQGSVTSVVCFTHGNHIAASSKLGDCVIWDEAGAVVMTLQEARGQLRDVAVSPDGQWVATASSEGFVRMWPATVPLLLERARNHVRAPSSAELAPYQHLLGGDPDDR